MPETPFGSGKPVAWRSRPGGQVGHVFAGRVLVDTEDLIAIVQPTGSAIARRSGPRGGPNGRTLLPGSDIAGHVPSRWDGPTMVRLHPIGESYSVIRSWNVNQGSFEGWYVNLERPWIRTAIGFDSEDQVLDIEVADDLGAWRLKDEDELGFMIGLGAISAAHAESIHRAARHAVDALSKRTRPFDAATWTGLDPSRYLEPVDLLDGWDRR